MNTEIFNLVTFDSTHNAIKAEEKLISSGIKVKIIPVPTEITSGCGLSIKISLNDFDESQKVLIENNIEVSGYYCIKKQGLSKEVKAIF